MVRIFLQVYRKPYLSLHEQKLEALESARDLPSLRDDDVASGDQFAREVAFHLHGTPALQQPIELQTHTGERQKERSTRRANTTKPRTFEAGETRGRWGKSLKEASPSC